MFAELTDIIGQEFKRQERIMKSQNECRKDLGDRLLAAARTSAHKSGEDFEAERWQLVADTIDMMIDRAIWENRSAQGKEPAR